MSVKDAAIVYDVRAADPGAHLYRVSCRIEQPDPEGQAFSMPAWIPGSYLVRDFARHVVSISAEADGDEVALRKVDKSTWQAGAAAGPLLIEATIYAYDLSVRGCYLDFEHGFINGVCLFFRIHGLEHETCVVHLAAPDAATNWRVATGMERLTGDRGDFGAFVAQDYDELIDHPFMLGTLDVFDFEVAGVSHEVALTGRHAADLARLREDMQLACSAHVEMFGGSLPLDRYVFLVTIVNNGYGGLEHRNSSALICSRHDLPRAGASAQPAGYRTFLGLVSHEYFHLWNVKRIRPAEFVPYDLARENYTRQLWVFEGITSYYDDLGLLRSGLIDTGSYLDMLGRSLTAVYRAGGRRRQTLEEASFDAWIKFYRQDENAPNALVSYYRKGAMVALALDLELRLQTDGDCTLDEVMRVLWRNYGDGARGLPEDGFEMLAEEVSGLNLTEFFRQSLRTTVDPPVGILLARFGVRLNMRAAESESDPGGQAGRLEKNPRPWLGLRTRAAGERVNVHTVRADGNAAAAGLAAGDEIVALNGERVTAAGWEDAITRLTINEPASVTVFRRDLLRELRLTATLPPRDTCYLTPDPDAGADALERRRAWLGG